MPVTIVLEASRRSRPLRAARSRDASLRRGRILGYAAAALSDASESVEEPPRSAGGRRRALAGVGAWLLCLVPLVGLGELLLHAKQVSADVAPEADWAAARELVEAALRADDLVVFAPYWADPIGRSVFGDEIATLGRAARSDERRFARAFEVSIRGARDEALEGWRELERHAAGAVTVTLYENPAHTEIIDDLVALAAPERLTVSRVDEEAEQPCRFQRGASAGGSTIVPQGLLTPADKFVCPGGGHVGVAVLHDLGHRPRLCLYATPLQGASLRLRFSGVRFGESLFGHSGVQWVSERKPSAERVSIAFSTPDHRVGDHFHKVGAGWTGFELPTPELDGRTADLVAEIPPASQRQFCFEATTRRAGGGPR